MKIHSLEKYRNIMKEKVLFDKKIETITSIAKKFGIPLSTVSAWYRGRQPIYKFCINTYNRKTFIKRISDSAKLLTPYKSYLLGVICGDGYVNYKDYYVSLETVTVEFIYKFRSCFVKVYGPNFCGSITPTCNGKQRIIICGKEMTEDIKRYLPIKGSFCWRAPEAIKIASEECKIGFLQGFFDSEGSVSRRFSIELYSSNKIGLSEIKELFKSIKIKTSKIKSRIQTNKPRYVIYVTGKENIVRFINIIGTNIPNRLNKMKNLLIKYGLNPQIAQSN